MLLSFYILCHMKSLSVLALGGFSIFSHQYYYSTGIDSSYLPCWIVFLALWQVGVICPYVIVIELDKMRFFNLYSHMDGTNLDF
jgi:hypothetical protein